VSIITQLRILARLQPVIKQLETLAQMKFSWNVVLQGLATAAQGLNAIGALLPPKYQIMATMTITLIQAISAFLAHFANPDGTPAATAYTK
jgi:hypothetical protein